MILKIINKIINFIFPPRCIKCWIINKEYDNLCPDCWKKIKFITKPYCYICGIPFLDLIDYDDKQYQYIKCEYCHKIPKNKCNVIMRSVMYHDKESAVLIFKLKYNDHLEVAKFFAKIIQNMYPNILEKIDIICPVPLHKLKLIARNYNQSAVVINYLNIKKSKKILNLMHKIHNTKSQVGLSYAERVQNVANSITLNPQYIDQIKNKKILIIDDVCTTGTTLKSCSKALLDSGAKKVYCITLTHVWKNISYK